MSGLKYTTSYHTKFPEYIYKYSNNMIPCSFSMSYFKWFHENSDGVFVSTDSMRIELEDNGFKNIKMWSRGVDHSVFNIHENKIKNDYEKPIWVYCGRVSIEKNIEFFLKLDLEGEKIVIGDGPDLHRLKKEYNSVHFVGKKNKKEISDIFNVCDCFIFPSKTDTFGIVIIEALACGLPVVAFDVTGPKDILNNNVGRLCSEDNFVEGCKEAILIKKEDCYKYAQKYTWENVAKQFIMEKDI
jgi:glycosyltransferase involved in cell wall biosynthesis